MTTMSSASPRPPCGVNGELDVHLKSTPMGHFPHLSQTEIQSQRVPVGPPPYLGQEFNPVHSFLGGVIPPPYQRPFDDDLAGRTGGWKGRDRG